jgi:hypothetical protein
MKPQDLPPHSTSFEQVYLIDRDPGLLCRILGMYAARGLDVSRVDYAHAAQDVMRLDVRVSDDASDPAESLRVLVDKIGAWVGVIAAAVQPVV